MRVVVTGGCGFIGSHQVAALIEAGHEACVVDDLSRARPDTLGRLAELAGRSLPFHQVDVARSDELAEVLVGFGADAVIHFAGYKSVPESVSEPIAYYRNNLGGLVGVVDACRRAGVAKLVFSSSGSVYGETDRLPITEDHPHRPTNPYSTTKSMGERILADVCAADEGWAITALRYFNPAGAHPTGLLGEDPIGPPQNLLPALTRAATTATPSATVYGDDFATPDGSGVRDYVHVMDVALTHLRALERREPGDGFLALNIGRGVGVSVFEMIDAVERASGRAFAVEVRPRRPGDVSALYGDTTAAEAQLGPIDYRTLDEICADAWRWESTPHPTSDAA